MVRIDAAAVTSGTLTAVSVPKTKSRTSSAPRPPNNTSTRTLGPPLPPMSSWSGSRPVRCAVIPGGAFARSAARTCLMFTFELNPGVPGG